MSSGIALVAKSASSYNIKIYFKIINVTYNLEFGIIKVLNLVFT